MVRWPGWVPILVGALAMLLYAESVAGPFQYDDWFTVVESDPSHAQAGPALPGRPEAFRPVTTGSRVFDHAWALLLPTLAQDHPAFGFHLNNVILHGAASALVWWVVRLWWADALMAALAGALFAIHPFHSEAVNYISARSSVLAACWELAALGAYTSWRRGLGSRWWMVGVVSAAAALGAKESAVTLPLLLWLVDAVLIAPADGWRARVTRLWPWAVLVAGYVAARLLAVSDVTGGSEYSSGDRLAALATGLWILGAAARDAWWPWSLSVEHGIEPLHGARVWLVLVLAALAAIGAVVAWRRRRSSESPEGVLGMGLFALAWWVAAALPTLALPFITHVALYLENRFYLASVGFIAFGAWLAARAWRSVASRAGPAVPIVAALVLVIGLVAGSHARTTVWKSEVVLWRDAANKAPGSALAHAMLGAAYLGQNRPDLAIKPLEQAVRLDPRYPLAATNLGAAY
ncbi:MAG TPA: hypothetical protein VFN94_09395, partial [Nitrospiria bacterium]|nr:hypothetical protein [Nitrospiria bacterium]